MASPYPISGIITDSDSSVLASLIVSVMNVTTGETQDVTTNASGQYLVDCANFSSGYTVGDVISIWGSSARMYKEELVTTTVVGSSTQNLSLTETLYTNAAYCSPDDIRAYTRMADIDATDSQLHKMILQATSMIDERTGRTWKGVTTKTDEYYDGDGTDELFLNNCDLGSITSLAIDDNDDGDYTTVTTSYAYVYSQGRIVLKTDAEVSTFTPGHKTVKITYTYGNSKPTPEVQHLCILMVANFLNEDPNYRRREINDTISRLGIKAISLV